MTTIDLSWIKTTPHTHFIAHDVDCYQLFSYIKTRYEDCYFFESLAIPRHQDRYVSLGFGAPLIFSASGQTLTLSGDPDCVQKTTQQRSEKIILKTPNPYKTLQKVCQFSMDTPIHAGGLVGYFSHESVNYFEPSLHLEEHPDFATFKLGLFLDNLVYDTTTGTLLYYGFGDDHHSTVSQLLQDAKKFTIPSTLTSATFEGHSATEDEFIAMVNRTKEKITQGYSFQAEVGFKSFYTLNGDKNAVYNTLRKINPGPYMYYLKFQDEELFGASPEILISCKQGRILTTPTAGTIVRGKTEHEDTMLARTLLNDPKEIAEHNMLIDLHRNDIATISDPGSVQISDLMYIIRFSHVQHIVTNVEGMLSQGKNAFDVLACILPGGVVTGAPKIETIKIIAENENTPRGPYGGAVGRFSFNGDMDFCLPIRSLFCKGDSCFVQTSAGVVYDSMAEKEYQEVQNKLAAMEQTLNALGAQS